MFNGYNETQLVSYEYNQGRLEKKQENVAKWSYGHEAGVQSAQTHPNSRHSEFWPAKANFLGAANGLKCNCTGCYPSSENQSYQGDTTRHRPWLPRTFPIPFNGSNESCKLPAYQWDNGFPSQGHYSENNLAYVQEGGGKYPCYRGYQNTRIPQSNQPGVITSVKEVEFGKKGKNEMMLRRQESPIQNGAFCNSGYNLTKRPDGRNYCEANDKHSNVASYAVDQHLVRLPVVEPFIKAVPSNFSQNRVPSTGYRSVKENLAQSYIDSGYGDSRKMTEPAINGEKRTDSFPGRQLQTGVHIDYSHLQEAEPQKLFFDNTRNTDYYSRNNIQDVIKRNNQTLDNRKDCAMSMSEQHYDLSISRSKYQDLGKPYETFYPKDFDKRPENPACFQRNEDTKNDNINVHARLPRSALLFNGPRFADRAQNSFTYQSNPNAYKNYLRPEYPYQGFTSQDHYEYPGGFRRNEISEFRAPPQQTQSCEQLPSTQQIPGYLCETLCQQNPDKMQQFYSGKPQVQSDPLENRKPTYLETIRSEEINKNGTNKISPLRLLRKKKFINVPQEPASVSQVDGPPGLDVRKFWSTWADEEEENVAPTQMVVLDCQNIDPEQAKLLHLYETDPVRAVHLETGNIVIKGVKESTGLCEEIQEISTTERETDGQTNMQEDETEKEDESISVLVPASESKSVEPKNLKKVKLGKKKGNIMDKWTEKKFDFLKRAEESKAAEILRYEEEKKKIIETTLSLQQSLKKAEKSQEKNIPFEENSQSGTEDGIADAPKLPTCEYRRNKFLDYSEKNVIVNGKGKIVPETHLEEELKKEENIKVECSDNPTDMLLKLKEETGFEMEDILKKMAEINFEGSEIKVEEDKPVRKSRKPKKKKTDELENNDRTDELTVETVAKPTFKFSIQKSHDLKISFKVLNSKEEGGEDPQDKGSALEDSEFTLRYKTFQRDTDRVSSLKKKRCRKKKRMKTPVLKIKKSRYMHQEEKDPLADDDDEGPNSFADGFQVQETVDSAKIKLTFKRHKGNFETEYKINSNNVEKVCEGEEDQQNQVEDDSSEKMVETMKKSREETTGDVKTLQSCPDQISDGESSSPSLKPEEDLRNLSTSTEEENYDFEPPPLMFAEIPSDIPFDVTSPENIFEETDKPGQEQNETDVNHVINRDEASRSETSFDLPDANSKEEIEEISLDFIKSTKSPEIEINHKSGDLLEIENSNVEINCGLENQSTIINSSNEKSSCEFKMEDDDEEKSKVIDDLDNQTSLLDLISVVVEETKISENSVENQECKNSPLEISKELENSLEDLIRDDFSPSTENLKLATPEMPSEALPETEAEPVEGLSIFELDGSNDRANSEPESAFEEAPKVTNFSISSETVPDVLVQSIDSPKFEPDDSAKPEKLLSDDLEVIDCCLTKETDGAIDVSTKQIVAPTHSDLEDGEIIDSSDEDNKKERKIEFINRKIDRRHSISVRKRKSENYETWSRKKFSKAKSCPPGLTFPESSTPLANIPVEEIPLPVGPPPLESCLNFEKYKSDSEAKEKPKESIFPELVQLTKEPESPFDLNDLEKCRNPSPPVTSPQLGILQRNSKIKFSFSRRSKFSKLNLQDSKIVASPEALKSKKDNSDIKEPIPKECQTEEVPKVANEIENSKNDLESVKLLCENPEENVEIIDPMTDLMGDEFYECEDIPTSEDLTNGDDLENEKVNDDKFRNIMQNCLDNAKKFLNVGNLKLFSCSVDDLLELDCQPEPSLEENEPEKPSNLISRDILLSSCGDTEDLGLSKNLQPGDIPVDFVPSFCSDICPEILPVDNWPYLEEEVTSSPNKSKQEETDLVMASDNIECPIFCPIKKTGRKRVISETSFPQVSDEDFRMCSNVEQRRKTIDSLTAPSYKRDISDFKNDFLMLNNKGEKKSLKCRLSLEKLTNKPESDLEPKNESKNGVTKSLNHLDYKSPSWQPKVMLFRISKNELRKISRTNFHGQPDGEPLKLVTETEPVPKKQKSESEVEKGSGEGIHPAVSLSDGEKKRKKSRFRNLHSKRKSDSEISTSKKEDVDPEIVLTEIFKNCDVEKTKETAKKPKEDPRREKKEYKNRRDEERQKCRRREDESRKRGRHDRSKKEKEDKRERSFRWICEVCGFDEPKERVVHIKNHPFHCQSCYLAFKTESHFISHLTKKHKDIRNQHHCLLCELSFDTEEQYQSHLTTREHKHLESVEKNTINTLFTLLTGAPCPVLGLVEPKPEWLPNQAGTVHFYHQATPLSLALQYLKMHRDLSSFSTTSSTHPT